MPGSLTSDEVTLVTRVTKEALLSLRRQGHTQRSDSSTSGGRLEGRFPYGHGKKSQGRGRSRGRPLELSVLLVQKRLKRSEPRVGWGRGESHEFRSVDHGVSAASGQPGTEMWGAVVWRSF